MRPRVARASRIYVEGRARRAELVEQIWGDDLRDVGVVVEKYLAGVDHLPPIVTPVRGPARDAASASSSTT